MDDTMGTGWTPEPPKQTLQTPEERFRSAAGAAEEATRDLKKDLTEKGRELKAKASDLKAKASETLSDVGDKVDGYVSSNPKAVALGALGAGLVVGLIAGVLVERSS